MGRPCIQQNMPIIELPFIIISPFPSLVQKPTALLHLCFRFPGRPCDDLCGIWLSDDVSEEVQLRCCWVQLPHRSLRPPVGAADAGLVPLPGLHWWKDQNWNREVPSLMHWGWSTTFNCVSDHLKQVMFFLSGSALTDRIHVWWEYVFHLHGLLPKTGPTLPPGRFTGCHSGWNVNRKPV